jgi:integrase
MYRLKTRDEAIATVLNAVSQIKHENNEVWNRNFSELKLYLNSTEKTSTTILNDGFAFIHYLFPYLVEKNVLIDQITEDDIAVIATKMTQKPSSIKIMVSNILAFVNWVKGRKKLQALTTRYLAIRKGEIKSNVIEDRMTDEHVVLIINNLKDDEDKLAVMFMAKYGLRISEALGVRFSDFEETPNGSILTIRYRPGEYGAKGPKGERRIPRAVLSKYGLITDDDLALMKRLIINLVRKAGSKDKRLIQKTKRTVQYNIEQAAKRAEIPFRVHAHLFRHHFVAQAVKKGVPINVLSVITGDRPETLNKYYIWLSPEAMLA